ncbi:DegQ family serine endoprotease [Anaeromyxobacter oryzae]|uniref:Probable periplasmic serine endoprotease DegP-like n=1 Tax=Anaeromyxobacter oryzae TaxID=2918170 RepID=A0ABN6MRR0_9BACT|nr:DegQ family serine endoprotease [Anaeromyxobacter oryzae]BDG02325.1 serine protease [Anaeromyxobacter oryzae]
MTSRWKKPAAVATALVAAVATGYLSHGRALASPADVARDAPSTPTRAAPDSKPAPTAAVPDFSAIVQRYGPAVVNVSTTGSVKSAAGSPFGQLDPSDPFYPFFRQFGAPGQQGRAITRGLGSGFVVAADGVILTNAHVVAGANEVKVKLTDKREFPARVVGVDKASDVAVLKIDAKGLPTVRLGDPSRTKVGEWVLAIGSPFGLENTATAGILSARGRSLPDGGYVPFLQTDVAVNPGNSGGPLFDSRGEVIGINSQIYSQSGGYMGLSFAIPIDLAMNVEQQLLAHGKVTRGQLGVTIQDVNQSLADSFGLPGPTGALVSSVQPDSPAARAGIQPGDVILSLNGSPVSGSSELPPAVAALRPGTEAKLEVFRDGHRRDVEVRVGEAESAGATAAGGADASHGKLGLAVRPLSPDERRQVGVDAGVVVEGADGPAARAGIQPGDIVLAVNGTHVKSVEQLRSLVDRAGKHLALLVDRGDARIFVPVDLG